MEVSYLLEERTLCHQSVTFLPAVIIDLKQDFWSIRGQIMYFAFGLLCLNVKKHRVRLMPVAIGTTKQLVTVRTPAHKKQVRN